MHGAAAHKMDKPPSPLCHPSPPKTKKKYPCDFRDVGKYRSQNGEKMPMTNAERKQNLLKQTAMGQKKKVCPPKGN